MYDNGFSLGKWICILGAVLLSGLLAIALLGPRSQKEAATHVMNIDGHFDGAVTESSMLGLSSSDTEVTFAIGTIGGSTYKLTVAGLEREVIKTAASATIEEYKVAWKTIYTYKGKTVKLEKIDSEQYKAYMALANK